VSGQLHAPSALPSGERAPVTHWIGAYAGSRAGLDAVVRRKTPSPYQDTNPRSPITVDQRYNTELSRLPKDILVDLANAGLKPEEACNSICRRNKNKMKRKSLKHKIWFNLDLKLCIKCFQFAFHKINKRKIRYKKSAFLRTNMN
jgi:hypothetical protein